MKFVETSDNEFNQVMKNSPFTKYYQKMIAHFGNIIFNHNSFNVQSNEYNPYFNPFLMNIIIERLYHMPMWTGVLLHSTTRLSNNPVECYFKIMKHHATTLKQRLHSLMPSETAAFIFKRCLHKYIEFYEVNDKPSKSKDGNSNMNSISEKWKKTNQTRVITSPFPKL